tara:strand:+ start:703 stop:882 length:180 start_codon:yes stop_codon:yes gene_type:complete
MNTIDFGNLELGITDLYNLIELLEKLDDGEITRADLDIHHDIIEPVQEAIDLLEKVNLK